MKQRPFEPAHEIMPLFVLRKLILQTRMRSHPMGLNVWFLVGPFVYFDASCVRTAMALARLRGCAGSPEPSLVAYVISTIISWAGSFGKVFHKVDSWLTVHINVYRQTCWTDRDWHITDSRGLKFGKCHATNTLGYDICCCFDWLLGNTMACVNVPQKLCILPVYTY